jgi:nitrogen fixation uncharacterized protein
MSVEACVQFFQAADQDPQMRQQLKAMTGIAELIWLGRASGYAFDARDLAMASARSGPRVTPTRPAAAASGRTGIYHYEYSLDELPEFAPVVAELPRLKIKPSTVDLAAFADAFRAEDLHSTALPPGGPEYQRWREKVRAESAPADRRDFHLINLDDSVAHPEYDDYLAAKTRVVAALEDVFGDEVRFSGSMWYPPSGYRLWHTNEDQPGWRMYVIDVDEDFPDPGNTSFFRYQHPDTGELVTLRERPRMVRFFKIEQDPGRLFWHCIVNPTERHRWSFGFAIPDGWIDRLPVRL